MKVYSSKVLFLFPMGFVWHDITKTFVRKVNVVAGMHNFWNYDVKFKVIEAEVDKFDLKV